MTQKCRFPFRLNNSFFVEIRFQRREFIKQEESPLTFNVQFKVISDDFPDELQISLKLETPDEYPVDICLEQIGLFGLVDECDTPNKDIIPDFINERALFTLWPQFTQTIKQMTAMMGMAPIEIGTPYYYAVNTESFDEDTSAIE